MSTVRRSNRSRRTVHAADGARIYRFVLEVEPVDAADSPEGMVGAFLSCVVRAGDDNAARAAVRGLADDLDVRIVSIDEMEEMSSVLRVHVTVDVSPEPVAPEQPDITLHWFPPED